MSLARLQDTKSIHRYQSYFYTLAMSHQKLDFKKHTKQTCTLNSTKHRWNFKRLREPYSWIRRFNIVIGTDTSLKKIYKKKKKIYR